MSEAIKTIVFGKTGGGKTEKVKKLVAEHKRVLFFDTLCHDYNQGVIINSFDQLKKFWRKCFTGNFRIVFRTIDHDEDFPRVCRLVAACKNMSFVVEEADLYFNGGTCCREFKRIIFQGRHYGINLYAVTQRPYGIGRGLTSQTKAFYIFRTNEPNDLKYFRDRCGSKVEADIQKLEQYQYVEYFDDGNNKSPEIKKDTI